MVLVQLFCTSTDRKNICKFLLHCLLLMTFWLSARPVLADNAVNGTFETDKEFDNGSGITLDSLSTNQINNLAMLGKVWGFLKYHHPLPTSGQRQWDYDLLRIVPAIVGAQDKATANGILHRWIDSLGPITECTACADLPPSNLYMGPAIEWIRDEQLLGPRLSADLRRIYVNRPASGAQFYVDQDPYIGNPKFLHEADYNNIVFPDAGFQLLALFRFWNIVQYWAPYRDVIGENWEAALLQSIPKIGLAKDRATYELEMMALIARIHDTHANLWSSLRVRPPVWDCALPVSVRFIGHQAVVTGYTDETIGKATGLQPGDIVSSVDGVTVDKLVEAWAPYYAASNEPTQLRDMARGLTNGTCGDIRLSIRRDSDERTVMTSRQKPINTGKRYTHDRDGETFQRLADDIAYLKLSSVKKADVQHYLDAAAGTRGLIIDIRNYPAEFVVFALGQHLVEKPTDFVRFTKASLGNPGAFYWSPPVTLHPQPPYYSGKVVILVDEVSQSQAEYTSMAFRAAPGATVIGSTTGGADGNTSHIALPGGLWTMISGLGVFYPDGRATQRVGIIPDIEVTPTVAGIRAGRDELLEAAIAEIRKQ